MNDQERFWTGDFGTDYTERNNTDALFNAKVEFFKNILIRVSGIDSVIEFGANRGLNLRALRHNDFMLDLSAVEINPVACEELHKIDHITVYEGSMLDFKLRDDLQYDLSFTNGVLIHIAPEHLPKAYHALYEASCNYILIAEYYNPTPVEIDYRGHSGRLWKRDFAGEMLDTYPDLTLIDYGFCYHRDPSNALCDVSWFLLEKQET